MRPFVVLFCFLAMIPAAVARQDPEAVRAAIENYLRVQTKGLPGQVTYVVHPPDPRNQLIPCDTLDVSQAPGARPWGRTNVTVRCLAPTTWSIFVPVHIRVMADYLVAARPLAQGQTVTPDDLIRQRGDLSDLPTGILTDEAMAVGRTIAMSIAAGRPLRSDMLRQALVVQQNQTVQVISKGAGFQVSNEGRALSNGHEGQVVQVRLANGQVISGIARSGGTVEVSY
jgi:flagella basal body P-ring formation protein FlgA